MTVEFYQVEFYDENGNLDHNAVARPSEIARMAQGRTVKFLYRVETEDALNMTHEERGVA